MNGLIGRAEHDRQVMSAASLTWQHARPEDTPIDVWARSEVLGAQLPEDIRHQAGELAIKLVLGEQARANLAQVHTVDADFLQLPDEASSRSAAA